MNGVAPGRLKQVRASWVAGEASSGGAYGSIDQAERCIPDLQVQIVPGTGHMIAMEAADTVNAAMLRFLRNNSQSTRASPRLPRHRAAPEREGRFSGR